MKPNNMFWVELIEDTRKKRSLALKFVLPVVLILPFTLEQVSASVRSSGLPLIALFLGVLGSSVGLSGLKERGITERLSALPVSKARLVSDYLAANIVMDGLQMIAPAVILGLSFGITASSMSLIAVGLLLSLMFANSLGVLMAVAAGSSGEVHLYSGLSVLAVAGMSGIFFEGGSAMQSLGNSLPFGVLKDGLSGASAWTQAPYILASAIVTSLVLGSAVLLSGRLFSNKGG